MDKTNTALMTGPESLDSSLELTDPSPTTKPEASSGTGTKLYLLVLVMCLAGIGIVLYMAADKVIEIIVVLSGEVNEWMGNPPVTPN